MNAVVRACVSCLFVIALAACSSAVLAFYDDFSSLNAVFGRGFPEHRCDRQGPRVISIGNSVTVPGGFSWTSLDVDYISVQAVPEPASVVGLLRGLGGIVWLRKR